MRLLLAARLSVKQKDGQDGLGLDTQDKNARAWGEREGHQIVAIAADTKSGTVAPWDRKSLKPWVTDPAKMAEYDGVLAYKTDRLSRGTQEDFTRIEMWATQNGKALIIVDGPMYPARDDSDYWRWAADKRTARKEWEAIQERTVRAQRELRERGKLVGRPPWGYEITGDLYDKTLTPSEEGRRLVPEVFRRIVAGDSAKTVAAWLEAETGQRWWPRTVAAMVRRPVYIGHRTDAKGKTILRCEALVDAATFKRADAALRTRPKRGPSNTQNRAKLRGALFCGRLGCTAGADSPMYRIVSYGGVFYRCAGRGPKWKGCGNMVALDVADAAAGALAAEWFTRPVLEARVVPGHDHSADLESLRFEMRQLSARELPWDAEDAERGRLRAEYDRVAALPVVPEEVVMVKTGRTYADVWDALPDSEKGEWLKANGLTLCADNRAMWFRENSPAVRSMFPLENADGYEIPDRSHLIYIYPPRKAESAA
jgi:DNA invertase Pin-like site-specific DNA recombinase